MTGEHSVSRALATFAAGVRIDDLPADVVHQAVRCLVDWLGCTIAGSATAECERVRAGIGALDGGDGSRTAAIVGTRQRGDGRLRGPGQRDRRARARLRRHLQPRPDHDPRQRSAVASHRRGR